MIRRRAARASRAWDAALGVGHPSFAAAA